MPRQLMLEALGGPVEHRCDGAGGVESEPTANKARGVVGKDVVRSAYGRAETERDEEDEEHDEWSMDVSRNRRTGRNRRQRRGSKRKREAGLRIVRSRLQ